MSPKTLPESTLEYPRTQLFLMMKMFQAGSLPHLIGLHADFKPAELCGTYQQNTCTEPDWQGEVSSRGRISTEEKDRQTQKRMEAKRTQ